MLQLTIEQFKLDRQVLADFIDDADTEIFYGFDGIGGSLGWHLIIEDYPSFSVLNMGATFEEALAFAKLMEKEREEDEEEDDSPGDDGWESNYAVGV